VYVSATSCEDEEVKEKLMTWLSCLGYIKYYGVHLLFSLCTIISENATHAHFFLYLILSHSDMMWLFLERTLRQAVHGIALPARRDYLARAGTKYYCGKQS
jgi:hypothetical protein